MTVSTRPLDMLEVDAALDQERDKEAPIAEGSAVESTAEASIAPDDANDE